MKKSAEKETYENYKILTRSEKTLLAKKKDLPTELLYKLAEDKSASVRWEVATRANLPSDLVYRLSEDSTAWVRNIITKNNFCVEVIIRLSCDKDEYTEDTVWGELRELKSLSAEDLKKAYDLIYNSKYTYKKGIEYTYDYLSKKFPELSEIINFMKNALLRKM